MSSSLGLVDGGGCREGTCDGGGWVKSKRGEQDVCLGCDGLSGWWVKVTCTQKVGRVVRRRRGEEGRGRRGRGGGGGGGEREVGRRGKRRMYLYCLIF